LNTNGVKIRSHQFKGKAGNSLTPVDLYGLPAGVYYVALTISGKTEMKKVILLN
jgi:hypothetical protein